ncbi:MAG: hypothetical protein JO314_09795, partial [Acidobacteria bacterium]|nr:hypothetical protein [Acidobacteriota bacterium]
MRAQTIKRYKPQLIVQSGHADQVEYITFSPDGRFVLSSDDRSAKLWDVATQAELRDLGKPSEDVFSPDSRYVVEGLSVVDVLTGVSRQVITPGKPLTRFESALSKDGSRFGYASLGEVVVVDPRSGRTVFSGTTTYTATAAAIDMDARLIATWGPIHTSTAATNAETPQFDAYIHITDSVTGRE